MENNKSKAKINWKVIQDSIKKKTPRFLISDEKSSNIIKITKADDEIIINCDNENHKTIPDSVFNYFCSINTNKKKIQTDINDNFIPNPDNNLNDTKTTLSNANKEKITKQTKTKQTKTSSKGGKKTRRKN